MHAGTLVHHVSCTQAEMGAVCTTVGKEIPEGHTCTAASAAGPATILFHSIFMRHGHVMSEVAELVCTHLRYPR